MSSRLSKVGNPAIAILVGIGAAVAIGGAVLGTVLPQTSASVNLFASKNAFNGMIILVGTLSTLAYFQFSTQRDSSQPSPGLQIINAIRSLGSVFIATTFGALFAGVYIATLTAFIERFTYLWSFIKNVFLPSLF